jgi:ABC-type multidrug transport system ATPase subunit
MIATLATADRLLWTEDHHATAVAAAGTAAAPARLRSGIALRDLSFRYPGTERVVLSSLTLNLPAGATVAIVGENGSGKTTLVKLLLGMYQPTSGVIEVDDVPLSSIAHESWRQRCTAAFQDFARFALPAVESVGVADLPGLSSEPLAQAALDRAGAADLAGQLPSGLSTFVGGPYTGGQNLSGGQWQKLALGRAMRSPDPLLVVLDEPTASLDAHAEQALFDRYTSAAAGYAADSGTITLLVSHRFATVRMADLIIYLEEGHATEAAPTTSSSPGTAATRSCSPSRPAATASLAPRASRLPARGSRLAPPGSRLPARAPAPLWLPTRVSLAPGSRPAPPWLPARAAPAPGSRPAAPGSALGAGCAGCRETAYGRQGQYGRVPWPAGPNTVMSPWPRGPRPQAPEPERSWPCGPQGQYGHVLVAHRANRCVPVGHRAKRVLSLWATGTERSVVLALMITKTFFIVKTF